MINDLKAMAIFAEVIKMGSFRAAAKELNLAPSVVSYHISQLEKRVGVALIYRSTRHLSMTCQGELFHRSVVEMLSAARQGIEQLGGSSVEPTGQLKISLPSALANSALNIKLAKFAKRYPKKRLSLSFSDNRENIIEKGIDIAIRAGALEDSNLKSKSLGEIKRLLVCTPEYYNQHDQPQHIDDLAHWHWIKLAQLPNVRKFYDANNQVKELTFSHQVSVDNVSAMSQFCQLGLGLATLGDYQVEDLIKKGQLVHILPHWRAQAIPLNALWAGNVPATSNIKRLLDFLKQD